MRIEKITLRNFRGVGDSTVEFSPGVTIVAGPNEVGKSSIAEALRVLRTYKDSSKAGAIRALQPVGRDVGPEVEVELTTQGHHVWMRKRWLRKEVTELRVSGPSSEQLQSDEAHDRFVSLLGETVDIDLLEALEVVQGESLRYAKLAGLRSLTQALDTTAAPVAEQDELVEKLEAEYAQFFTLRGHPRGAYRELETQVGSLREELEQAQEKSREMDDLTHQVERENTQLQHDQQDLSRAAINLEESEEKDRALSGLREQVDQATAHVELAEAGLKAAQEALETRNALREELTTRQEKHQQESASVDQQEHDLQQAQKQAHKLRQARDKAEEVLTQARQEAQQKAKRLDQARHYQELQTLTARVQRARAASERKRHTSQIIAGLGVDDELWQRINDAATQVQVAQSARETAAAQLSITPLGEAPVSVDGQNIDKAIQVSVTAQVKVEAPGVVELEVHPGVFPEDLRQALDQAEQKLQEMLDQGNVETVEEARQVATQRGDAEAEQRLAQQALEDALGEDTLEELEQRHARLVALAGDGVDDDVDTLRSQVEEANDGVTQAEELLNTATAKLSEHEEKLVAIREAFIKARADREHHKTELERLSAKLDQARSEASDDVLDQRLKQATLHLKEQKAKRDQAHLELEEQNPEAITMHLDNAKEWHDNAHKRVEETKARLHSAKTLLEDRAKDGLYDLVADLQAQVTSAEEELDRMQRRAQAVRLLREVMIRHRDAAHARYVTPFTEEIQRIGKVVFGPDFGVEVTPELEISHRHLDGQAIAFSDLSAGAQEQLGLIGRLAAAVLIDPDDGAPVILDDTLGFADDDRLASFGAVLNDVGKKAQIIVLTCQPSRFSQVGGAKMVHLSPTHAL